MSNATAIGVALCIVMLMAADQLYLGWDLHIRIGRWLEALIEWLAFWR